jgi:hypothetical protein
MVYRQTIRRRFWFGSEDLVGWGVTDAAIRHQNQRSVVGRRLRAGLSLSRTLEYLIGGRSGEDKTATAIT